jgi:hypothetical protein
MRLKKRKQTTRDHILRQPPSGGHKDAGIRQGTFFALKL